MKKLKTKNHKTEEKMKKYTKKEIAAEYDCMASVKGPYPEGDVDIKAAIIKAEEPYNEEVTFENGTKKTMRMNATSRRDIIDRAYDLLNNADPVKKYLAEIGRKGGEKGCVV